MRVEVYADPKQVSGVLLNQKTIIVVDVLRSTTSVVWAIRNGAHQVIPALDPEEAAQLAMQLERSELILAGESGGLPLPGFALGNSPLEFSKAAVQDKTIIMSTSNGTPAFHKVQGNATVFAGAMINRKAVAGRAFAANEDIVILCAGTNGQFSADDICCAGAIIDALVEHAGAMLASNDLARVAYLVYLNWKEGRADLGQTHHYSHLKRLGMEQDLEFCFQEDITDIVPVYQHGIIQKGS